MREQTDTKNAPTELARRLNLFDSTSLVIGAVLGSGIFMTSGFVAERLPSPALVMSVFLLGGFITLAGALSFAELGAMYPKAGGPYVYLRQAYGSWAGFFYGWVFFWVIQCGGIAALAVAFTDYLGRFLPSWFSRPLLSIPLGSGQWSLAPAQLTAIAAVLILSGANYFGIKSGSIVQNVFTVIRLAAVAVFVFWGLLGGAKSGAASAAQFFKAGGEVSPAGFGLALVAVLWAFDGWYSVSCTAEEVKNPRRNIPLSLFMGTLIVTVVYLLLNTIYFLALPVEKLKGVERVGELAAVQLFGPKAGAIMTGLIAVAIFGCLSGTVIYGPRVFYAMAKDGLFFKSLRAVHPRFQVPHKAILAQALWSSLLCLSGRFQALYEFVVFALVLFFAATGMALIVLRFREPGCERPYRVLGYPVLPVLFIGINLAIFVNRIIAQPKESLGGAIILAAGIPAYFYWRSRPNN